MHSPVCAQELVGAKAARRLVPGSRCPTSVALLGACEKGVGLRRTGPVAILKIKCIWVKACVFLSQAASLEYLVALDGDSQAPFTELRWNLVQIFSLRNKVLSFLLLLLLSS